MALVWGVDRSFHSSGLNGGSTIWECGMSSCTQSVALGVHAVTPARRERHGIALAVQFVGDFESVDGCGRQVSLLSCSSGQKMHAFSYHRSLAPLLSLLAG